MSLTSTDAGTLVAALAAGLPAEALVTDPDLLESYRYDRAQFCPAGVPAAVVLARETAHVQHALRTATSLRVPVVPQGARSGLSGAANAIDGCVVVSTEKMRRIRQLDVGNRFVVTQPGIYNAELSRAVAEHGLFYPPDPSSWEFCSIGGNLSTNSGGLCCVKYGVTTDYVLGLEVVLASGEVLRTGRRTVKGVAGYDLTRLFVGSEGTLGIITEATLSLRPAAGRPRTAAALFASARDAGATVAAVVESGLVPSLLEIMDRTSLRASSAHLRADLPGDCGAMLVWQSDSPGETAVEEVERIGRVASACGATQVIEAEDPAEAELLLAARRTVLTALEALGTTLIDDVAVPRTRLADLIEGVQAIAERRGLVIGVVGHAGDGNMHPTVVFDPADPVATEHARSAFGEIMDLGLELGGTITGEHGVGVLKRRWLEREAGAVSMAVHRAVKAALDPLGILNPGKVFDPA
ncbi:MAG TPA: FAD-linked oxidase C-terminal domain-containing protein [Kineosporiaceae bacterium]|nr:FAD-linked oxidase C-terminal domain-containing protein [Kineosporiaceae bacterium]